MTVGKDVSSLFTDVVNCMQTENLELKKLVYLYLINYAKSQPDLAILAVNTFVKVCIEIFLLLPFAKFCYLYFWYTGVKWFTGTSYKHEHNLEVESFLVFQRS